MNGITIQRLGVAQVDDYKTIRFNGLQQDPDAFGSTYAAEILRPNRAFEERIATSLVLGAYADGAIVGMVGLHPNDGMREQHKAYIWGLYVRAEARRRGVGAALMTALIHQAPPTITQITLTVVADNQGARILYERWGFNVYGTEPRSLQREQGYADEVLMVLLR